MVNKKLIVISCAIAVCIGFALGIYGHLNKKSEQMGRLAKEANSVFNRSHSPTYGSSAAKVRIVEFFDPACETCRAFYPLVKNIVDSHPGEVQLVVRYAPFHNGSESAVKILEAARLQDLFWPVTEAVLKAQPVWASHASPDPEKIWGLIGDLGLNVRKAKEDIKLPEMQKVIDQDLADAEMLKVTKTPGFFVNGRRLENFGHQELKELVQAEVSRAYPR